MKMSEICKYSALCFDFATLLSLKFKSLALNLQEICRDKL